MAAILSRPQCVKYIWKSGSLLLSLLSLSFHNDPCTQKLKQREMENWDMNEIYA